MTMRTSRRRAVLGWLILGWPALAAAQDEAAAPAQPVEAQPTPAAPPAPANRGTDTSIQEVGAGRKFALVVGVNYEPGNAEAAVDRAGIGALNQAEPDARAFAAILKAKYGYGSPVGDEAGDWVELMTEGPPPSADGATDDQSAARPRPTKAAIEKRLMTWFCNPDNVGADDSVLFFFSGHAVREDKKVYLLPADVATEEREGNRAPTTASMIDLDSVVEQLQSKCKARHVLMILDCCHSGGVFSLGGFEAGEEEDHRGGDGARSFQAMTASRAYQLASDGRSTDDNSPFTRALLRALEVIPAQMPAGDDGQRGFTANELFAGMKIFFDGGLAEAQSPQCRWLPGSDEGEFQFVADPGATFEDVDDEAKRVLLTMVPSTFGNWWADEMPWFMPSLRLEILKDRPETRSAQLDEVDKRTLFAAAKLTLDRLDRSLRQREILAQQREAEAALAEAGGPAGAPRPAEAADLRERAKQEHPKPEEQRQIAHLRRMLDLDHSRDRTVQLRSIIRELDDAEAREGGRLEATELHFRAVLRQLVDDDKSLIEKDYVSALGLYAEASRKMARMKGLEVLCRSDFAYFRLAVQSRLDEAFEEFRLALEPLGPGAPAVFRAFCLMQQATARRRLGFIGASDLLTAEARGLIGRVDPEGKHPLSAAAWKQSAWADMELWRFKAAGEKFDRAEQILDLNQDRDECLYDTFHVRHGLAMIERFRGEDAEAIRLYGELIADIPAVIRRLETRPEDVPNLAELRELLYERLENAEDRLGDCYLFGRQPDYDAAAYHYRRAIQTVEQMPKSKQDTVLCDLLYRQVIALAMEVARLDRLVAGRTPSVEEAEARKYMVGLALHQREVAEGVIEARKVVLQPKTRLAIHLADACMRSVRPGSATDGDQTPDAPTPAGSEPDLVRSIDAIRESKTQFDRDELERLMFAYRVLMSDESDAYRALEIADRLHEACRSTLRVATANGPGDSAPSDRRAVHGILRYLRPYHDAIFATRLEHQRVGSKDLIELVWQATTGELVPYRHAGEPVLAMYFSEGRCHLLLDAPGGGSGRFCVDGEEVDSPAAFRQIAGEEPRARACPDALRTAIRKLQLAEGQRLWVLYRDPVLLIDGPLDLMNPAGPYDPDSDAYFPFDVRPISATSPFRLGELDPTRGLPEAEEPRLDVTTADRP